MKAMDPELAAKRFVRDWRTMSVEEWRVLKSALPSNAIRRSPRHRRGFDEFDWVSPWPSISTAKLKFWLDATCREEWEAGPGGEYPRWTDRLRALLECSEDEVRGRMALFALR